MPNVLGAEFFAMLLFLGELAFAGVGLQHLLRKTSFRDLSVIESSAIWLFFCLFMAMLAGLAGLAIIPGLAFMTLLLVGAGVYFFVTEKKPWLQDPAVRLQVIVVGVLFSFYAVSCVLFLDRLIGLPTHHDGIAHTLFFLRVLEFGSPIVSGKSLPLQEVFGEGVYPYYPTGSHTFVAILSWWWHKIGLFNAAKLAKGFLLADLALLPWILYLLVRRLALNLHWLLVSMFVFLSAYHFRFPFWAVDSGGFSRIIGYTFSSILIGTLFARNLSLSRVAMIFGMAIPAGFALHPAGSWYYLSVAYGLFIAWSWATSSRDLFSKKNLLSVVGSGVFAVSLTAVFHLLLSAAHKDELLQLVPSHGLSTEVIWSRFVEIFRDFASDLPSGRLVTPRTLLLLSGLIVLPAMCITKRATPFHAWYAFGAYIVGAFLFIMGGSDISVFKMAISIFFDQSGRMGESFYLSQCIFRFYGFWGVIKGAQYLRARLLSPYLNPRQWIKIGFAILALAIILDFRTSFRHIHKHLQRYFAFYGSPFKDPIQDVADLVIHATPPDALILSRQLEGDILEAVTGRQGLFFYGYCPTTRPTPNCLARINLMDTVVGAMHQAKAAQGGKCLEGLSRINYRPIYVLVDRNLARDLGPLKCQDVDVIGQTQDYLLIKAQG